MTRDEMLKHIDAKAGAVRAKYITVAPGQEATYILKSEQARDFAAKSFGGAPPGLIAAEAAALGETPKAAAQRILLEAAAWANLAGQIEAARRTAKVGIQTAPSEALAKTIFEAAVAGFAAYLGS